MSLLIQSNKKSSTTNRADVFNLSRPITDGVNLALKSYVLTCNIDNVNPNNNNLFIDTGTQSFPVSVPIGKYSFVQLGAQIQTSLNNTTAATFNVVYSGGTYTITSSIPVKYQNLSPNNKSIWQMMGIRENEFGTTNGGGVVNIHATDYLNISSFELTRYKQILDVGTGNSANVLASVRYVSDDVLNDPTSTTGPETIQPKILSGELYNWKNIKINGRQTVQNIDIVITDDDGNIINQAVSYSLEFLIL
jgi:hypothetical protein